MAVNVIVTSLPPTKADEELINFAREFAERQSLTLYVLVCFNEREPLGGHTRYMCFQQRFSRHNTRVSSVMHNLPRKPRHEHDEKFWEDWCSLMKEHAAVKASRHTRNFFVGKDELTKGIAKRLDIGFIQYDPNNNIRDVYPEEIRKNPFTLFNQIMPNLQYKLRKRIVVYGAERVGKTELAKNLADELGGVFVPRYGSDVRFNADNLTTISYGQYAYDINCHEFAVDHPFVVQDTDVNTVFGYGSKFGVNLDVFLRYYITRPDLYIVMSSGLATDPARITTDDFWLDQLKSIYPNDTLYQNRVLYLPHINKYDQLYIAKNRCMKLFLDDPLWSYKDE